MTWPVRVQTGTARSYVQQVPLTVRWLVPAWVGRRDLAAGADLKPEDMGVAVVRWPDGMAIAAAREETPPQGRLRAAVRAGSLITTAMLTPNDVAVRGDRVTAVLAQGGMELRMPGQLMSGARVGEKAKVQLAGRAAAVEGVLADLRTVMVETE